MQIVCKLPAMKAHTNIVLDSRRSLKTGYYPVKLRVTFNRKQRYYTTRVTLTEKEYQTMMGKSPKGKLKDTLLSLQALEQKANTIINKLSMFSFETFKNLLYSDKLIYSDVYSYYTVQIENLKQAGQIGTASNYQCSLNSLKAYKSELKFGEITVAFLQGYENWLIKKGKSISTVGIYLRPLRAIVNMAREEGFIPQDFKYPFGKKSMGKYQIPAARNIKKALGKEELKKILDYTPAKDTWEMKCHDYWTFIYLANGMNMMDVARLRYSNIDGEYIRFVRQKTERSSAVRVPITVYLQDRMKEIIQRQGIKPIEKDSLIFPIINPNESLEKQRADVQQMTKMINKHMGTIMQTLSIDKKVTTYTARHTFSTILKKSGVGIQVISEALGHSSINTTRAYLDSFDDESKKEMASLLIKL
jgi:integrase/recombinase XerD